MNDRRLLNATRNQLVECRIITTIIVGLIFCTLIYSIPLLFYNNNAVSAQIDAEFIQATQLALREISSNVTDLTTLPSDQFPVSEQPSSGFVANGIINSVMSVPAGKWLATGNWSMTLNGNLTSFQVGTTWYNSSGTNAHTHELTNFIPTDPEQLVALDSLDNNVLEGFTDVGTNGQISWTQVPTTISFNAGKIINVSLDDTKTNQHFAAQPLMGIVNSFVRCSDTPTPNMEVLPPCSATAFQEESTVPSNTTLGYPYGQEFIPPADESINTLQRPQTEDKSVNTQEGLLPEDEPVNTQEGLLPEDEPVNTQEANRTTQECKELTIKNVSASGFETDPSDYHPPSDAIDGDSATWWSNKEEESWLQLDLDDEKMICSISIEWNKGETRKYAFEVELSKDGNDFQKVFEGTNKGDSSAPETYQLDASQGRYLKLSVTNTSSENGWVSIKEINLSGNTIS